MILKLLKSAKIISSSPWKVVLLVLFLVSLHGLRAEGAVKIPFEGSGKLIVDISANSQSVRSAERYVATYTLERKWSDPVQEVLLLPQQDFEGFALKPGQYRLICSAVGFGMHFTKPFEIERDKEKAVNCPLGALSAVTGKIVLDASIPRLLNRFHIGPVEFFSPSTPTRLSAKGMAHLQKNYLSESDGRGFFELHGPENSKADIWVFGGQIQPTLLRDVLFGTAGESRHLGAIELKRGFELSIALHGPDDFPWDAYFLGLRSAVADEPIPIGKAHWYRAPRPNQEISYEGLPAGSYSVWLKPKMKFMEKVRPLELGVVSLGTTERARFAATVEPAAVETDNAAHSQARPLHLLLTGGNILSEPITLVRWQTNDRKELEAEGSAVVGGLLVEAPEACDHNGRLQVKMDQSISTAFTVDPEGCSLTEPLHVEMYTSGTISGKIEVPVGFSKPSAAHLSIGFCEEPDTNDPKKLFPFEISPRGEWTSQVPVGCLVAKLQTPAFSPLRLGHIEVKPHEGTSSGVQQLHPAAVLMARIISTPDQLPVAGALTRLVPLDETRRTARSLLSPGELQSHSFHGTTDRNGWVALNDLPSGSYRLLIVPDGSALLPTLSPPFLLAPGEETLLEDIELPVPATVEVVVETEGLESRPGEVLTVRAEGAESCDWLSEVLLRSEVDEDGKAVFSGVHPGQWIFGGDLGRPDMVSSPLVNVEREVFSGETATVFMAIEGRRFDGRVTFEDDPVAGRLSLRLEALGTGAVTESDISGRFSVVLEKEGAYSVTVEYEDQIIDVPDVDFTDPTREVMIELPSGSIAGRVLNANGEPVSGATVWATAPRSEDSELARRPVSLSRKTAEDGSFHLAHLVAREWRLRAGSEGARSKESLISLSDAERKERVDLTLEPGIHLQGNVRSGETPMPGIRVIAQCGWQPMVSPCGGVTVTDHAGSFDVLLPDGPPNATVFVSLMAPDGSISVFRSSVEEGSVLQLPAERSRVVLTGDQELGTAFKNGVLWLVHEDGGIYSGRMGRFAEDGNTSELILDGMMPGAWQVVELPIDGQLPLDQIFQFSKTLSWLTLSPGEETRLTLE